MSAYCVPGSTDSESKDAQGTSSRDHNIPFHAMLEEEGDRPQGPGEDQDLEGG